MNTDITPKPSAKGLWPNEMVRILKCLWLRANVILGWPLIFLVDVMIVWMDGSDWKTERAYSNRALNTAWNRYANVKAQPLEGEL